jgi:hypothetical protein
MKENKTKQIKLKDVNITKKIGGEKILIEANNVVNFNLTLISENTCDNCGHCEEEYKHESECLPHSTTPSIIPPTTVDKGTYSTKEVVTSFQSSNGNIYRGSKSNDLIVVEPYTDTSWVYPGIGNNLIVLKDRTRNKHQGSVRIVYKEGDTGIDMIKGFNFRKDQIGLNKLIDSKGELDANKYINVIATTDRILVKVFPEGKTEKAPSLKFVFKDWYEKPTEVFTAESLYKRKDIKNKNLTIRNIIL